MLPTEGRDLVRRALADERQRAVLNILLSGEKFVPAISSQNLLIILNASGGPSWSKDEVAETLQRLVEEGLVVRDFNKGPDHYKAAESIRGTLRLVSSKPSASLPSDHWVGWQRQVRLSLVESQEGRD